MEVPEQEYVDARGRSCYRMIISQESSIYTSNPFTFNVQSRSFYVHSALISKCSRPLDRMISGHLKEANQGFANLNDVTEATFTRFVRWLYVGDYPAASHKVKNEGGEASIKGETSDIDDWGSFTTPKKKKKKKEVSLRVALKEKFIAWEDDHVLPEVNAVSLASTRSNTAPDEDYTNVLLSHAQLYVFGEKYDIKALQQLSLRKLRHTLATFTLYQERVDDILSLIRYTFAETGPTRHGESSIRTMLMFYVSTEMEVLDSHGEIKGMLAEDPEMMNDFLAILTMKINEKSIA